MVLLDLFLGQVHPVPSRSRPPAGAKMPSASQPVPNRETPQSLYPHERGQVNRPQQRPAIGKTTAPAAFPTGNNLHPPCHIIGFFCPRFLSGFQAEDPGAFSFWYHFQPVDDRSGDFPVMAQELLLRVNSPYAGIALLQSHPTPEPVTDKTAPDAIFAASRTDGAFPDPPTGNPEKWDAAVIRAAIPIFMTRVSPLFDSCTRVLLIDIEQNREVDRKEIYLDALSLNERVTILRKSGVTTVICGGISEMLETMLAGADIELIGDITGEVDQVLDAYLTERLDEPRFHLPVFRTNASIPGIDGKEKGHESR
jgi:predicted Fe-Mo cluster-binding NifX family protein